MSKYIVCKTCNTKKELSGAGFLYCPRCTRLGRGNSGMDERKDRAWEWAQKRREFFNHKEKILSNTREILEQENSDIDDLQPRIHLGELHITVTTGGSCWIKPFPAKYAFSREDALRLRDWLTEIFE